MTSKGVFILLAGILILVGGDLVVVYALPYGDIMQRTYSILGYGAIAPPLVTAFQYILVENNRQIKTLMTVMFAWYITIAGINCFVVYQLLINS